jgi:hypothetical protein
MAELKHSLTPEIERLVREAARKAGVPERLALALVQTESSGDPNAVSSAGALGLTQIMPATAKGLYNVDDPNQLLDPKTNVDMGLHFLNSLFDRYGDWDLALSHYYSGSVHRTPTGSEVNRIAKSYVAKVNKNREAFSPEAPSGAKVKEARKQLRPGAARSAKTIAETLAAAGRAERQAERQAEDAQALGLGLERGTGATAGGIAAAAERQRVEALLGYGNRAAAAAPLRPEPRLPPSVAQLPVGGNFGIPDRGGAAYYGMDYGALPPSTELGENVTALAALQSAQRQTPELGENVTALAELQRAQRQAELAESRELHEKTYRQQFGGPVPSQVTPREYRDTMLDLFTPGGERTVMAPLTFLGGAAKALFSGAPPDPGSLEEHARQAAMLYGTQDIPGGGFSDAEVTARKAIEAEAGGVDVAGAGGEGGVGAAILNFMRGGDLTPEQIFQRSMSQREHDREIAMQFGTGDIEGGGFSRAEEAAYKAQQLDILNKARARARAPDLQQGLETQFNSPRTQQLINEARALENLGFSPRAPQSTLPPAPPLPTGAEATFGPEYGMREPSPVPPLPTGAEATFGPEYGWPPIEPVPPIQPPAPRASVGGGRFPFFPSLSTPPGLGRKFIPPPSDEFIPPAAKIDDILHDQGFWRANYRPTPAGPDIDVQQYTPDAPPSYEHAMLGLGLSQI